MSDKINQPFRFKSGLELPNMLFPGPMEGVMSPLFCNTAEKLNLIDFWMTPFIRITTGPVGKTKILKFTNHFSSGGKPVIVQLMGTDAGYLIETATRCRELGFAGVNFNLACPSKQVLASNSGGFLLKDHRFIQQLMEESLELGKDFSLSLKIRIGFESPGEIAKIANFVRKGNPDFVVVHYRTVTEAYEKVTGREERLTEAVKHFDGIPIIANGDIDSHDADKLIKQTGCSGIMIARNWLKNPNLIRDILTGKKSTTEDTKKSFAEFMNTMAVYSQHNPRKGYRSLIIDIASYVFDRDHPFFEYIIHSSFKEPVKELSKEKILSLI